ncbi:3-isopropylmalate dehydratase large subunit [Dirofilaria immitis]
MRVHVGACVRMSVLLQCLFDDADDGDEYIKGRKVVIDADMDKNIPLSLFFRRQNAATALQKLFSWRI